MRISDWSSDVCSSDLRTLGLTRSQWSVLAHLARNEGINQAALAETLEIEPITLVRLLDRLEAAEWVERQPDPNDRRARLLRSEESRVGKEGVRPCRSRWAP